MLPLIVSYFLIGLLVAVVHEIQATELPDPVDRVLWVLFWPFGLAFWGIYRVVEFGVHLYYYFQAKRAASSKESEPQVRSHQGCD